MRRPSRRNIATMLVAALALVTLPAAAPPPAGDVRLVPPAGQTAVRGGQDVGVQGTTDPSNVVDRTTLSALDAAGTVLDSYDLAGLVRNNGGTIEGAFRLGCSLIPGCESGDGDLRERVAGYQLELELATTTGSSIARTPVLEFDELRPRITGYFLTDPNRIEVRFSEDVADPEGDNPGDWQVDGDPQVIDIEGEGDRRVLITLESFGADATPRVDYLPNPSLSFLPNKVYQDEAGNTLTALNRFARAADRIPPVPPTIDTIDGTATSRDGDDQAVAVLGSDATPTVVLGTIEDGHTGQLFLDDGDGTLEDNFDTFVGEAVAAGGSATIEWPAGLALPDDEHRLFARTLDGAACDPDNSAAGSCPNESGRSKDALYDLDTTEPTLVDPALASTSAITVVVSEAVTGPSEPADWTVTAPGGGPGPAVTGVSGSGDARVLAADGVLPGSTLTYAPAGARLADTHGNELQDVTIDVIAAPVPVARLVDAAPVDEKDGPPTLPPDPLYAENEAIFRVELSDPVRIGETATLTLELVGVDATVGTDLEDPGQFTVDIGEGESGADVAVELRGDTLDEFHETFELRVVSTNDAVTVADGTAVGTITDDDPLVALSVADVTVTEGAVAEVTASIGAVSGKDVVADWTLEPDTASPGADYEAASGSLTIPAGETSVTVPVTTLADDLDEADTETLRLVITEATSATMADGTAVVSITDDDPLPTITIADVTAFEGDEPRSETLILTLSEVSGRDVTVAWSTSDGTATAGSDYTAASGSVTIPAGASGGTVALEILGDTDIEDDEDLTVTLSSPTNATINDGTATVVLLNDDGDLPPITLDVTGGEVDEDAGGVFAALFPAQVTYTLTLSEPARGPIRVDVRTTADGSATPDVDFESAAGTVEIAAGATSGEFTVDVLDDDLDEFDELLTLEVLDPVGADLPGGAASTIAEATIIDDDDLPTVAFTDDTAAKAVNEGDSTTLTVELDTPSGRDVTVGYATRYDGSATDADAPVQSGTVLVPAGSTSASFDIATSQDDLDEPDEDFQVDLEAVSHVALADDRPVTATITIADDEVVLPVLTLTGGEVNEDDGLPPLVLPQLVYTATLSAPTTRDVTVDVRTAPGGTATPEDDFTARAGTITIEAGETTGTFGINVIDDALDEFDETVIVLATDPVGARFANGLDQANATGTITDDDPVVSVSLAGDVEVAEGDPATFTVELSRASGKDVRVRYSTDDGRGSAEAGPDYPSTSGELTIVAGETSGTFVVPTRDDADVEPDETVIVAIEVLTPESATLGTGEATLTILDDDVLVVGDPVLGLTGGTVEEGDPPVLPLPPTTTLAFDVSLSAPADSDVVLDYATSAGTATADADYEEATGQVTIAEGEDSAVIEVTVLPDTIDEFDEDLTVTITGVTGPAQLPSGGLARDGVITDDDPLTVVGFAEDAVDVTVGEGDAATFTVELRGATEKPVTVEYATSYDGAATTDDAPSQTGTLEFPVGTTSATFSISTTQDDLPEGDEALSVVLSTPVNAALAQDGTSSATLTIADDEVTLPTLTVEGGSVDESEGIPPLVPPQLVWTFTLSESSPVDVTASYRTTAGGSATPESDFVGRSGTVTIPADETSTTILIDVIDDDLDEFIEEVPLVVSDVVNAELPGGVDSVTELGRITDDDPVVTVSLGDDVTVTEGEPATIEVLLDRVSGKDVRVGYATRDSGATAGDDYDETVGSLTIRAGDTRATFTVPTRDDLAEETDEDVAIDLTVETPDAAELGRGTATLTIQDDDLPIDPSAPPVVGLTGATVEEGDPIGPLPLPTPMTFEVRLSRPAEGDVTLAWETRPDTATAGEDFTADSGSVTVPDGDDTAEVTIDVLPDLIDEFDEDLVLALTSVTAGSATIPGDELTRRGRILDDDPLASLGFDDASIDIGVTEGGTVELTVELTGATEKSVSVDYAVSFDGGATSADAPAQSGTLDLPAGTTTATFPITTLQDDLDEPNEAFSVVLSDATGATIDAARRVATVTIADDDLVVPVLSVVGGDVDEGAAGTPLSGFAPLGPAPVPGLEEPLAFTVTLSEPAEVDVLVDWATTDLGTAVAGSDYAAASGTLTIPAGETSATVEVDVFDDDLDEFDEDVVVRFSNLRNARFEDGGSRLDRSGRITDDDPLVTVALGDDVDVAEGDPATFDVTLSAASGKDVRVRLSTEDGAARSGADYRATTTTLTIPAGETAATFTVPTFDDSIVEPTEDATVRLEVVDADTAELGRSAATLSITDDDVVPTDPDAVVVSLSGDAVEEGDPFALPLPLPGGSTLAFVIRLSAPAEGDVTIDYETRAGTATAGDDFTAVQGEITIPDGSSEATIEVPVTPDTLDEFDEDLTLALTGVRGDAVLPGGELERTGRILDDDDAAQLRVNDATVLEGSTAELDVTLNTASGKDITVGYRFVDGTATAGADYVATSGTLTFPAGTTSRSVEVATLADTDTGELIEQFELVLSAPTNAALDDPRGTVSIVDIGVDGLPTVTAVFLEDITTVEADGDRTALVPVRLSAESAEDVTVTWSTQQLTATDGEDYRAEGGQVVIPAGATSAQIPVTIIGDDEVEPNEDFLVLLTAAEGAVITGPTGRVTIEDDDAEDDGGPGGGGGDGAPDGEDDGAVGADDEGDLAATGGGAGFVVFGLGLLAARRRRREDD